MLPISNNLVLAVVNTESAHSFNVPSTDLLSPVHVQLQAIASSDDFFARVLGEKANTPEVQAVRAQWSAGDFSIFPKLQILDALDMVGFSGAYSQSNQTIYLSSGLVNPSSGSTDPVFGATGVLIEETFHWLDSLVGEDTPGDEGELARHLIFGITPNEQELARMGQENDWGFLTIGDQAIPVELSADQAGNTLSTARNFPLGSTMNNEWVGNSDAIDYYQFTLSSESQVWVTLTGSFGDANLGLFDSLGRWLTGSGNWGTSNESIALTLQAGTYYVGVYTGNSTVALYNLNVSGVADTGGNLTTTAPTITPNSSTPARGWVGSIDVIDYYRFTLLSESQVWVTLTGLTGDANLGLFDSSGRWINGSGNLGTTNETIARTLQAGTYFVGVINNGWSASYDLNVFNMADTGGSLMTTAPLVSLDAARSTSSGWVGSIDEYDFHQFRLTQSSVVYFSLTGLTGDVTLGLFDSSGRWINGSGALGANDEHLVQFLNAGTYYLAVYAGVGGGLYNLNRQATNVLGETAFWGGDLGAGTFTYNPNHFRTVYMGNGNVDYGSGARDELVLSGIRSSEVFLSLAETGGVIYNPWNGNRVFDAIYLQNGLFILFEGIERLRFSDRTINLSVNANDPRFADQWNLHMMGVHNAWRFTTGTDAVLIGVQDTGLGVDARSNIHPDLGSTYVFTNNFGDDYRRSNTSHGTPVQSIIAAASNNGVGMSGINWYSSVFSIDVLDNDPSDQSLTEATRNMITQANQWGRRLVINMSLGTISFNQNRHRDLEVLVRNNPHVLFVISAGNSGHQGISGIASPAILARSYSNVMAVGAVWGREDTNGRTQTPGTRINYPGWWGSQYGDGLTIMAPSEVNAATATRNSAGTVAFNYETNFNGTSAAAPHVTGVASLLWSINPNLTASQIKTIMSQTAYDLGSRGYDTFNGHGFVNAEASVRRAMAIARGAA